MSGLLALFLGSMCGKKNWGSGNQVQVSFITSGGNGEKGSGWRAKEEGVEVLARANNGARDYGGLEAMAFRGEDLA